MIEKEGIVLKKVISVILSLVFIFSFMSVVPVISQAADSFTVTFASDTVEDKNSPEAIDWWKAENGEYFFFLPSNLKSSSLRLWFDSSNAVTKDSEELVSGSVYDLGESGVFKCNGKEYKYNVISSSDVGTIYIETESGSLDAIHADKEHKESGKISIYDKKGKSQYSGDLDYIKGRGNATWENPKRPYNIKLGEKVKLFGMQKSAKWCLIANYDDATLSRNALMYNAAADADLAYSPECAPADVYINGEYKGSYLVTSKIEASGKRIDVENLDDINEEICIDEYGEDFDMDTLSRGGIFGTFSGLIEDTIKYVNIPDSDKSTTEGGYIIELELPNRYADEISGFVTTRSQSAIMKCPEYASQSQMEFISDYYQRFEDAVFSDSDKNENGEAYYDLADMTSLCKYYLVSEWSSNMDSGITSTYFYLDSTKDGKLYAGPVWDYDIAFGNNKSTRYGCDYTNPNEFTLCYSRLYRNTVFGRMDIDKKPTIYNQLCTKQSFVDECKTVWDGGVYEALSEWADTGLSDYIDTVRASAIMNHIRWNTFKTSDKAEVEEEFDEAAESLKSFVSARTSFLNSNLGKIQEREEKDNIITTTAMKIGIFLNNLFESILIKLNLINKI